MIRTLAAVAVLVTLAAAATPPPAPTGAQLYRECAACHALAPGESSPAGPTLHAVVGRRIAAEPGFNYSPALRRFALRHPRWTPALLDRFLADPEAMLPGTEMGYLGMADPRRRRILIDWLQRSRPRRG